MQGRFAHISDCHIGAWRDPRLREINDKAFGTAVDACIEREIDFVVISGDIFDVGIPDMTSVRSAVRKLRQLADMEIPAYVVYGSHDYSPTTVSVVDVLTSAGLFVNVGEFASSSEKAGGGTILKPTIDQKTGVRISGLPARRRGIEKELYRKFEESAEESDKYSIFVFHASINELQSLNIPVEESVSISDLPRGFSYYAGGHLHKRSTGTLGGSPVVYPGPLFGTNYADLEQSARGEKRGFAIVDFDGSKTTKVDYVDVDLPKILSKTFTAERKGADEVGREILAFVERDDLDVKNAIVLLKARGTLGNGRPSDINWYRFREELLARGASVVSINRMSLSSQESKRMAGLAAASKEEIESKILAEKMKDFRSDLPALAGLVSSGTAKATMLLRAFKTEKTQGETKQSFDRRIWQDASEILNLPPDDEDQEEQTRETKLIDAGNGERRRREA